MQTIEFKTKNEAKKRADLLKNDYKTTKVKKHKTVCMLSFTTNNTTHEQKM